MRTIGTTHRGYFNDRCITQVPHTDYRVVRAPNAFRLPNGLWFRLTGRIHHRWLNSHWSARRGGIALLHLLNGIHRGRQPWVTTFETYLPRWGAYGYGRIEGGLKHLVQPNCHRLIALSECARRIQEQFLADYAAYRAEILAKVQVIGPPQALKVQHYGEKELAPDRIDFTLVGADFFRKGGLELLRAFARVLQRGAPVRFNIVSRLQYGDYASQTGPQDLAVAQQIIARHPGAIVHHSTLPNPEVLALFRRTHVGLLPTWGDTYGFSVLEAQANACPVITTDLRALPEINGADRGWLISVEKDSWGNAVLNTEIQRRKYAAALTDHLEALIEQIVAHPEQIAHKGAAALDYVRRNHNPHRIAAQIAAVYDAALGPE